jgi:hypothetical protein
MYSKDCFIAFLATPFCGLVWLPSIHLPRTSGQIHSLSSAPLQITVNYIRTVFFFFIDHKKSNPAPLHTTVEH